MQNGDSAPRSRLVGDSSPRGLTEGDWQSILSQWWWMSMTWTYPFGTIFSGSKDLKVYVESFYVFFKCLFWGQVFSAPFCYAKPLFATNPRASGHWRVAGGETSVNHPRGSWLDTHIAMAYWCVLRRGILKGMIHWRTINFIIPATPSNPFSNPTFSTSKMGWFIIGTAFQIIPNHILLAIFFS